MSAQDRATAGVSSHVRWPEWTCPEHGCTLVDREDEPLFCQAGNHAFRRIGGTPRFVSGPTYADPFGLQWKRYRLTQLDSYTGTTISRDRLRSSLGDEIWDSLPGMHVLECGCGAGRFTEVLLERSAFVTSVDLSEAVDANAANFAGWNRSHRVTQADIAALPFKPGQFDLVLCLGVLQHTRSTTETIRHLIAQVKPTGFLVVDHYTYSLARLTKLAPLYRLYFRRLPAERGLKLTETLVDRLLPIHRRAGALGPVLGRISPVASYYRAYPQLSEDLQREWSLLDTHDSLTDYYKRLRTAGGIRRILEEQGLVEIRSVRAGNGVEARARKPAPRPGLPPAQSHG